MSGMVGIALFALTMCSLASAIVKDKVNEENADLLKQR